MSGYFQNGKRLRDENKMKYRKIPVVIEAFQWTEKDHNNLVLIKHCMTNDESIMDTLERLCQLAGVIEE